MLPFNLTHHLKWTHWDHYYNRQARSPQGQKFEGHHSLKVKSPKVTTRSSVHWFSYCSHLLFFFCVDIAERTSIHTTSRVLLETPSVAVRKTMLHWAIQSQRLAPSSINKCQHGHFGKRYPPPGNQFVHLQCIYIGCGRTPPSAKSDSNTDVHLLLRNPIATRLQMSTSSNQIAALHPCRMPTMLQNAVDT